MATGNVWCSLVMAGAVCLQTAQAAVVSVGDMVAAQWTSVIVSSVGSSGTLELIAPSSSGNPGSFWQNGYRVAPDNTGLNQIRVANIFNAAHYDPVVQGAISALTFSYDTIRLLSPFSDGSAGSIAPALLQDGHVYSMLVGAAFETRPFWHASQIDASLAANWTELGSTAHPDFTAGGSDIQFGYRANLGAQCPANAVCRVATLVSGLDNFRVDITSVQPEEPAQGVPEPASAALVLAGLGMLGLRRKRCV